MTLTPKEIILLHEFIWASQQWYGLLSSFENLRMHTSIMLGTMPITVLYQLLPYLVI